MMTTPPLRNVSHHIIKSSRSRRPSERARGFNRSFGTVAEAIAAVERGEVAVVDVRVEPGYTPAMTAAVSNAERKA